MKVIAIVGMSGSGKSEVSRIFENNGFIRIRFGDITDEEITKRGQTLNEENERCVREQLRIEYGMDAYAKLNLSKIDSALKHSNVVIDGLYSWEEYSLLKSIYNDEFVVLSVWSSPKTRYQRLGSRYKRPLNLLQASERDKTEIEHINKGGPIAMADYMIINDSNIEKLHLDTKKIINLINQIK
jgi:dephospho-CoA kinase